MAERGGAIKPSDVTACASVSRQAVYLHFGDRTGLLIALVDHMDESLDLGESGSGSYSGSANITLTIGP